LGYYGNNTNLCWKRFEQGKKLGSTILIEHKNKEDKRYGEACSYWRSFEAKYTEADDLGEHEREDHRVVCNWPIQTASVISHAVNIEQLKTDTKWQIILAYGTNRVQINKIFVY
jgi:hypothetical protein